MHGVVFTGDKEVEIRTLPDPRPGPGEVVIAMKASGLCGSDLRHYRAPRSERGDPANLKVAGHEPCGVIAEVGRGVTEVAVGDRVMMQRARQICTKCVRPTMYIDKLSINIDSGNCDAPLHRLPGLHHVPHRLHPDVPARLHCIRIRG